MLTEPALARIEYWSIEKLVEYARNPRKNDAVVDRMCASIREFGFKIPCLVRSDGEVVDGHLRLKAARKLGITEIPVILCDEWSEAQVKAFRLLVNRSVTWADWDEELLPDPKGPIVLLRFFGSVVYGRIREGFVIAPIPLIIGELLASKDSKDRALADTMQRNFLSDRA